MKKNETDGIKASKLIKMLQKAIDKYGDLQCYKTTDEPIYKDIGDMNPLIGYTCMHSDDGSKKSKPEYFILCDSEDADSFS